MVVQHNLTAMNSNRMLGITTGHQAKSTEKLSSGYKINRAADDAAGLTISEKMRKQMRGLDRASTNAEDGVSAVQTAEGALTEVHDMLQRMNELAVQASNGTNSESDRDAIQAEVKQLTTEIDRVAETTKFNETYLLKGGKTTKDKILAGHDAGIKGTFIDSGEKTATLTVEMKVGDSISIAGQNYNIVEGKGGKSGTQASDDATDSLKKIQKDIKEINTAGQTITINGTEYKSATVDGKVVFDAGTGNTYNAEEMAGKITDGTSVKYGSATKAITARDYTNDANITKEEATAKIQQALTQANNIGATKTQASVKAQSGAEKLKTIADGGTVTAKSALFAYDSVNKKLTEIKDKDDITKLVNDPNTKLYKAAITIDLTSADNKAVSSILVMHNDTLVKGVDSVVAAGSAPTTGTPYTVDTTAHTIVAKTGYTLYEEINVLADATVDATHEAYAKLEDGANTNASFKIDFEGMGTDVKAAEKMKEAQNALEAELTNINYTFDGANGVFSHNFTAGSKLDIDEAGVVSYDGTKIATITATGADTAGQDAIALDGDFVKADVQKTANSDSVTFEITKGTTEVADDLNLNLHVGADADMTNKITVGVEAMDSASLGIKDINVADDSGIAATYAIDAIADAIKTVSAQRSSLGAVQNRLEHTIANLDNVVENTTAAESRIRDTDMAEEMVEYSKNNILAQAGQSMLAQANQSNQGVLSLLG